MQAVKSIQFKVSSSLRVLEERIEMLYKRPANDPSGGWRASGGLYAGFSSKKGSYNEHQLVEPPIDVFRERLTPSIITYGSLSGQNPDLALLFLSYAVLHADARHRKMSDKEILDQFGEAPWVLLNKIFDVAGLPFRAESPKELKPSFFSRSIEFELLLLDTVKGVKISPNDLSEGEKVIVSMVFLHYTSEYGNSKYKLLLLDEPDTHLHPSFIKKYIRILTDVLVKEKQARVVMTTHSPITVALIPEASIHNLDRSKGNTPLKVSRECALETLLEGVPSLRVRYEQRRPIFVESKYDVTYYDGLVKALRRSSNFFYEPVFLAPHSGTTNCTDVIDIVKKLEESGSEPVYGIIDFDTKNKSSNLIKILGNGRRYAIENYLLDPIIVALALIKNNKKQFSDFGIQGRASYIHGSKLTESDVQLLVNNIFIALGLENGSRTSVILENGFKILYSDLFLMHPGHTYETKLMEKFPELNAIKRGKGDQALKEQMLYIISDFPEFLPIDIRETLHPMLAA